MKKSARYQFDPSSKAAMQRWLYHMLADYTKGSLDKEGLRKRFHAQIELRDPKQRRVIQDRLREIMETAVEGIKLLYFEVRKI